MADSQRLAMLKGLQTSLRAIRVADGYHYTIRPTSVVLDRRDLATIPPTELPFFCVFSPTPGDRGKIASKLVKEVVTVNLYGRVDANGTAEDRKTTAVENLIADIEKALVANLNLGGVAIDVWMRSPEESSIALGNDNAIGLTVPVEVRLQQRPYGAP